MNDVAAEKRREAQCRTRRYRVNRLSKVFQVGWDRRSSGSERIEEASVTETVTAHHIGVLEQAMVDPDGDIVGVFDKVCSFRSVLRQSSARNIRNRIGQDDIPRDLMHAVRWNNVSRKGGAGDRIDNG